MKGDVSKWENVSKREQYWNIGRARKIQELESQKIIQWLIDLKLSKYQILEVGCGNGYLGYLIISALRERSFPVSYQFTDLVEECLKRTEKRLRKLSDGQGISFKKLDVFLIDKALGSESQEIIISTGFVAAATYKQAVPKVAKVLKPKGILICDFVNHFSLPIFFENWQRSIQGMRSAKANAKNPDSKNYHFGKKGIKEYFGAFGLELVKMTTIDWRRNPLLTMFRKN